MDGVTLRDVVLVGGGHSHVVVLRHFGMRPEPGLRLTLVCTDSQTPYSGMLPGYVAGHYTRDEVHIDLRRLAAFAGARFIRAEVTGLDRERRRVLLRDRPPLRYDWVSINTGSTPRMAEVPGAEDHAVPVKPIPRFDERWQALLERVRTRSGPLTVAVVGGGAGGVELLLALRHRLLAERCAQGADPESLRFMLLTRDPVIMPTHGPAVRRAFERLLARNAVRLHTGAPVTAVAAGRVQVGGDRWLQADETIWVTQAGGPAWLATTGLPLDEAGFIRVGATLQSVGDGRVFAAGDVAAHDPRPLEKAGVFAVRMGRPLADNLRRVARGAPLRRWRPQRHWLALISTGDRQAVMSHGRVPPAPHGHWVWRWKDWIDRRFMRRFSDLPAMATAPSPVTARLAVDAEEARQAAALTAMRCGGCGAKVGAGVLSRALAELRPLAHADVALGLDAPDDAAVVRVPAGRALVQTVDHFRAFIDDPYVFGRIAANHALGDIDAMGAVPHTATAIAMLPPGLEVLVEDLLRQMMAGAVDQLNAAGCALVGGHSGEGRELALGFAITGLVPADLSGLLRKSGLQPGERLVLTKPLGTGLLLAALPHITRLPFLRGRWIDAALASMMQSSRAAAGILRAHGARAATDVTGFGLLGHLAEMTRASGVGARLSLGALPVLEGAEPCAAAGIRSSLAPANERQRHALADPAAFAGHPRHPLLFDPQTAGGLLAGVPADRADACVAALRNAACPSATVIGEVLSGPDGGIELAA